jgi:protein TonB
MLVTSCIVWSGRRICVLARESLHTWSVAFGLSALIHLGLAGALSGQSWMMREFRPPRPLVLPVDLVEPHARPSAREKPRPVPPPPRSASRKAPPPKPAPRRIETRPLVEPPPPEVVKRVEAVPDSPPAPAPPAPAPQVDAPPAANPASSRPTSPPSLDKQRDTRPGATLLFPEGGKSALASATAQGPSGTSTAVASVPRSDGGSSAASPSSGTSSGSSTRGVTQWARPRGGYQVYPRYPASARQLGIQGTAHLRVQVLADGHVGEIVVERSAGHPDLDRAAADAVRQWRFEPARRGAEAVATWVLLPVQFQLKRGE